MKPFILFSIFRSQLPPYSVGYIAGKREDMSCLLENNHDWTFDVDSTTTTTTSTTTTTAEGATQADENADYCNGKKDGLYSHPDCSMFYQCYSKGNRMRLGCVRPV